MSGYHSKDVEADKGMVRGYVQQKVSEIALLLSKVDRQLLLLFKTNDSLRCAGHQDAGANRSNSLLTAHSTPCGHELRSIFWYKVTIRR